jgi:NAD(P)-dependent dehydrogenase (short-subunit alcohol dehydrogenase family)
MSTDTPSADDLSGRCILVTGASRGIGRAVALAAAARGATVVLHGRDEARLAAVYDEIEAAGGPEPAAVPLDFSTATDRHFSEAVSAVVQAIGRLDGIAHCAAHTERLTGVDAMDLETWLRLARVNWLAPLALTRICLPYLRVSPDASVVYTLDSHLRTPGAWWAGVTAPRAALEMAMRSQAEEWAVHRDLRVNAIIPGAVASPSRAITHPGDRSPTLPGVDAVTPAYLRLLGPGGRGVTGQVVDALPSIAA